MTEKNVHPPMPDSKLSGILDKVQSRLHRKVNEDKERQKPVVKMIEKKEIKNVKKSSLPPKSTQKIPSRPIEQLLIGTWNAVKPESQGKWIMENTYDRWFKPTYQTEEERNHAALLRPKIEKIVGWGVVGIEAGLITFGVVKGYQKLRSVDWSRLKKPEKHANE